MMTEEIELTKLCSKRRVEISSQFYQNIFPVERLAKKWHISQELFQFSINLQTGIVSFISDFWIIHKRYRRVSEKVDGAK